MNTLITKAEAVKGVIDAIPACVFVMDDEMRILVHNRVATEWFGEGGRNLLMKKSGEAMQCLNAGRSERGCGHSEACRDCTVRHLVTTCLKERRSVRERALLEVEEGTKTEYSESDQFFVLASASPLELDGRTVVLLILDNISELMELQHLIPVCAKCKKIRDDHQEWMRMEKYFRERWDFKFTHGYCPQCKEEMLEETRHLLRGEVQK